MTSLASPSTAALTIQPNAAFDLNEYAVKVLSYTGQLAGQVWHFDVLFKPKGGDDSLQQSGFIRVGSAEAGSELAREVAIRTELESYQMIAPVLAQTKKETFVLIADTDEADTKRSKNKAVAEASENATPEGTIPDNAVEEASTINADLIDSRDMSVEIKFAGDTRASDVAAAETEERKTVNQDEALLDEAEFSATPDGSVVPFEDNAGAEIISSEESSTQDKNLLENTPLEDDYLEEELYDEKDVAADKAGEKLILLSAYPEDTQTLASWLKDSHTQDENLSVLIQLCQFFRYLHQRNWCFVHFLPQFIQLSKPIQFYDLTGAYAVGDTLASGLQGTYCAPELSYEKVTVQESLSSYAVGALLHQLIYGQLYEHSAPVDTGQKQIPRISQILNICLSQAPDDRFPLNQLLDVLLATRQALRAGTFTWETAHRSTVGLSMSRLQNEDSYGVRQQQLSNSQAVLMGVMADGMGGLAEGDVASKTAVNTFLSEPAPEAMTEDAQQAQWLEALVQKANDAIASTVREGGTTLSVVLAINKVLTLAHIGDSRIYLLRNNTLCQISEDHSYVAMLVASGEITHEESLEHPERNVLTKSLGSKRQLTNGYIQNMTHWGSSVSMILEDGDILLLCSDGVWDLVKDSELCETFVEQPSIQKAVNIVIDQVLARGASDNATLLALKLNHDISRPD